MKINKHIEIVRTDILRLSSMSRISCESIYAVLRKHYTNVGITTVNNLSDLEQLMASAPDLVFLGMEFIYAENLPEGQNPIKVWLSAYFDAHNITYTGSASGAMRLQRVKQDAKQCILDAGLPTSPFFILKQADEPALNIQGLDFPLFVKPVNLGGGDGIDGDSVVQNMTELKSKVAFLANKFSSDSLIEQYLPGREFSVAILKDEYSDELMVMPIEIVAEQDSQGNRIMGHAAKKLDNEVVLAVAPGVLRNKIISLATSVHFALGARDFGRVDIRLDCDGEPQFLEANLIPSLIENYGNFPKACLLNNDFSYENVLLRIVSLGLSRGDSLDYFTLVNTISSPLLEVIV